MLHRVARSRLCLGNLRRFGTGACKLGSTLRDLRLNCWRASREEGNSESYDDDGLSCVLVGYGSRVPMVPAGRPIEPEPASGGFGERELEVGALLAPRLSPLHDRPPCALIASPLWT